MTLKQLEYHQYKLNDFVYTLKTLKQEPWAKPYISVGLTALINLLRDVLQQAIESKKKGKE